MTAKRQHRVMQAILANNPRITVGEMARRLNYVKEIFEGIKNNLDVEVKVTR
ncbi:MAG: hypothetical protein AB7D43_03045 [Sulfurimonadaceae bacterium]